MTSSSSPDFVLDKNFARPALRPPQPIEAPDPGTTYESEQIHTEPEVKEIPQEHHEKEPEQPNVPEKIIVTQPSKPQATTPPVSKPPITESRTEMPANKDPTDEKDAQKKLPKSSVRKALF
ncbi:hypothetical protein Tco_0627844 [Tanacetum coccineum]|uniref:Uncharacterized protein n=1 Tax=Tanacetum coccineum TaxID=301880 RepID=A0ABQ4WNJ8_9ASTR